MGVSDKVGFCFSFPTDILPNKDGKLIHFNKEITISDTDNMMHKLADWENDVMSFFYGDGAGAAILTASDKPGFVSSTFFADGSYHKSWGIYSGGTFEPASEESVKAGRTKVKLVTPFPAEVNNEGWPARMRELGKNGNFELSEADLIIYTQVRLNSIKLVQETLGLPLEKAHWVMTSLSYWPSRTSPPFCGCAGILT